MYVTSKSDWKLFMKKVPEWQERYMGKLNEEYIKLLQGNESDSEKFWKLDERIKKDKKKKGVSLYMEKDDVLYNILMLIKEKAITTKDLAGFSRELKDEVDEVVKSWS